MKPKVNKYFIVEIITTMTVIGIEHTAQMINLISYTAQYTNEQWFYILGFPSEHNYATMPSY